MQCVVSTLSTFYVDGYNPIPPVAKAALTRPVVIAANVTQLAALSSARITVSTSQLQQQSAARTEGLLWLMLAEHLAVPAAWVSLSAVINIVCN